MPKTIFSQEELDRYFSEDISGRHCFYECSIEQSKEMRVHSNGEYPENLLNTRRPNESLEVMEYRKQIFSSKTKPFFSKIVNSLSKIRRSSDWSIRYENEQTFTKIREGELLSDYCERNFPGFTSMTNWVFGVLLKNYLEDPNAVIFLKPLEISTPEENNFSRPYPHIFDSCYVVDYVDNDFAILINPEGCTYNSKSKVVSGRSFFVITTLGYYQYDEVDDERHFQLVDQFEHQLGILPVYKIGGVIKKISGTVKLYESRLAGILPEFNEALREYSDLQAAKVLHIYPERWEFTQHECSACNGTGRVRNPAWYEGCAGIDETVNCSNPACHHGYVSAGPYSKIMVRPQNTTEGGNSVPIPPAGVVEKDIEIVKLQEEGVRGHIFDGLAAINFEFLMNTPLSESGVAKEVDRDELNNTVHSIAEDLVRVMDWLYWGIAKYRYAALYTDEELEDMVPTVAVPEKYDILSSKHLEEQLKGAKETKMNSVILNAMEAEYANKAFNNDPEVSQIVWLVLRLDPLSNVSEEDKAIRLSNKGISNESYVISSNIVEFVRRAIEEDEGFPDLDYSEQKKIIEGYAKDLIDKQAADVIPLMEEEEEGEPGEEGAENEE